MYDSMCTQFIHLTTKSLKTILTKYDLSSVLVVHGNISYSITGAEKIFSEVFNCLNVCPVYFSDFIENPDWNDVQKGLLHCHKNKFTLIIGIGGGSAMDMAKLIRFFYSNDGTPRSFSNKNIVVPLLLFPTTAGTGSEATHFAVCYMDGVKYSVADNLILPTEAYIDYRFTLAASPYLTACTGFDALSQAVESYWSIKSTDISRSYAIKAIKNIYSNLKNCVYHPSEYIREQVSMGSHFAGKAINISFTTAAHAYSYGITTYMHLPHGHAVACTFPYFFALNMNVSKDNCIDPRGVDFVAERMQELCFLLGVNKENCFSILTDFVYSLFYYKKFSKPSFEIIQKILTSVNIERLYNNPVQIPKTIPLEYIFENMYNSVCCE